MSSEGKKEMVFQTTRVRTKLKGDNSWLQRQSEAKDGSTKEKPWLAEVRAGRCNSDPVETSPVTSPTRSTPPPTKPDAERAPTSGYLIRGVFTKTEKPAPSSASNGVSATTIFTKKPSESYKKIAPYSLRPAADTLEEVLSAEEQEKRTEAASNVLKKSAVRQRSYVLSAAKKYETKAETADTALLKGSQPFVARRVEINDDDDDIAPTVANPGTPPPSPVDSVAPVPAPQFTQWQTEPVPPKQEEEVVAPEPIKEDPPPVSVTESDPFALMKPGCTKVDTPLPVLILEDVQPVSTAPEPESSGQSDKPLVELILEPSAPAVSPTREFSAPVASISLLPDPLSAATQSTAETEPEPSPEPDDDVVSLSALAHTLIAFDTSNDEDEPQPQGEEGGLVDIRTTVRSSGDQESTPEISNCPPVTEDLLAPNDSDDVVSLSALAHTLIAFDTSNDEDEPQPQGEEGGLVDIHTTVRSSGDQESTPEISNCPPVTEDLLAPNDSNDVVSLSALAHTLIAFDTSNDEDEPQPQGEEGGLVDIHTTVRSSGDQESTPEISNCPPVTEDLLAPNDSNDVVSLSALAHTLIAFDTSNDEDEPQPQGEEGGLVDIHTTVSSSGDQESTPEISNCPPVTEDLLAPNDSDDVVSLSALAHTLIAFDTSNDEDEQQPQGEEGGLVDIHTTVRSSGDQESTPEISNCPPVTEDLLAPNDSDDVVSLSALAHTLIAFDTSNDEDEPQPQGEEGGLVDIRTTVRSPEEPVKPVPPSPGLWSQDLLSGLDSDSTPEMTGGTLDLLANDVITINTEPPRFGTQRTEEKQTYETDKDTHSSTETVTITTKTVIITHQSEEDNGEQWSSRETTAVTESSPADPFDPYSIGTTSLNSSSDLLLPVSDAPVHSPPTSTENTDQSRETNTSSTALESLSDDVIPSDTETSSLSSHRWALTWDTGAPQSQETREDQTMMVKFERKSKENDSPWDRWTSPTVYSTAAEEEEEEKSSKDSLTETVTTITTIREIRSEPEQTTNRYETYSRSATLEEQQVQTPEPEPKRGFVYVKEYVDSTETAMHNVKDTYGGSDYLTSSSADYSYSRPDTYMSRSLSSNCTYCGELVGNDAKISIDHLNINSHPECFKCAVCSKPMGDLLDSMFLHGGKVHCQTCYANALD